MKTSKKIHKLGIMVTVLLLSATSLCYTDYRDKCIKDLKTEFKAMKPAEEKLAAKQIKIEKDSVIYKNSVIAKTNDFRVITVRLTVYWARGGDTDSDSAKKLSSTGYTLKQGDSIAVDPRIIPYDKEVIIPNVGLVKAVDTGTAVKEKRASGGKLPVIDVFFEHKKDAMLFANRYPKVVKVAVLN